MVNGYLQHTKNNNILNIFFNKLIIRLLLNTLVLLLCNCVHCICITYRVRQHTENNAVMKNIE